MKNKLNIIEQVAKFDAGKYDNPDRSVQCDAGWYDWFCKEESLRNKTRKLYRMLKGIMNCGKFDPKTSYVFFKNNCPMVGPLYDDFRICSLETGNIIYTIVPKCGHSGLAEVWGPQNQFQKPIVAFKTWTELKNWFNHDTPYNKAMRKALKDNNVNLK